MIERIYKIDKTKRKNIGYEYFEGNHIHILLIKKNNI